jgi:hypothetical protein
MYMTAKSLIAAAVVGSFGSGVAMAADFKDLVGGDAIKAFDIMTSRGFASVDTYTTSDDYIVTWWYNANTGQCVNTQSKNSRVTSADEDRYPKCGEAAARSSGGAESAGGNADSFETVCGVIAGGRDTAYRCQLTDHYSGSQKTRTTLRFPDQTIELTWHSGKRVGLQFEGMVPKESSYSNSEGETNWLFEGKTYYYFSDKERASYEVKSLRN